MMVITFAILQSFSFTSQQRLIFTQSCIIHDGEEISKGM